MALVTKHNQYCNLDLEELKGLMKTPILVDGRNVFDSKKVQDLGFEYRFIGKAGIE